MAETVHYVRPMPSGDRLGWVRRGLPALWTRRRDPRLYAQLALLALFGVALWAFGLVVEDYLTGDPLVRWDVEFSRWLHVHSNPALVSICKAFTLLGSVPVLALLVLAVTLLLVRHRRFNEAVLVSLGALGIEILFSVLKLVFHRPRPELAYVRLDTYSFPSGHASGAAGIYALLFYLAARHASTRRRLMLALAW